MSPGELRRVILRLEERQPITELLERELARRDRDAASRYASQKQHWLAWLKEYDGPGFYDRARWDRSAQFIYNHVQCAPMLLWLAEAAGHPSRALRQVKRLALETDGRGAAQSAAVRRVVPWPALETRLVGRAS